MQLWRHARLATLAGPDYGLIERGALLTEGGTLAWAGREAELPAALRQRVTADHDLGGALVTPGLVDCHTHLVYAGSRAHEFEQRLQGASYESIARAGGGILATVAATRAASDATLLALAIQRALTLQREGVTALEIKSGYGLTLHDEARLLRVARRVGLVTGLSVRTSYLAAHALPDEFAGRADDYVDALIGWLPALHEEGLVDAVDAFCDRIAFTPAQTRRVFEAARHLGLPVKLHAEQLSDQGGAALAASFGALSCDHLEHLGAEGIAALRDAGTVAVLLPGAYYFLRETRLPPVQALREAGVPIALATDHNPGSSPTLSPLLMMNMACTLFGLTPEEALRAFTVNGARALGLGASQGRLEAGLRADFAVWAVEHPRELVHGFGVGNPCRRVVVGGLTASQYDEPARPPEGRLLPPGGTARSAKGARVTGEVCTLHRGSTPLLVSLPHVGTEIPAELQPRYLPRALATEDADWHLDRLYGFVRECGASLIVPRYARYVIDLNRPSENTPMYPGANNTELCPTRFFTGEPLYRDGQEPDAAEVQRRVAAYWQPYHDALRGELQRLRAAHGHAVLFDGHSIQSELPWLFEGRLPDLNLGTADGASCAPSLRDALADVLAAQGRYTQVVDGRFKGGHITRHYGRPGEGVHAVQLEMCWRCYMDEGPPYAYDLERAAAVKPLLDRMVGVMQAWRPDAG